MSSFISNQYLIAIIVACVFIMCMPVDIRENLYLNLELTRNGQYWRFISGHFTHYSWLHCAYNIVSLILIFSLFHAVIDHKKWLPPTIFSICVISLGLILTSDSLAWYVGYSGVLVCLLSYACMITYERNPLLSTILLASVTVYVFIQIISGGELFASGILDEISTSSYAHAFGLLSGITYGLLERLRTSITSTQKRRLDKN